MNLKHLEQEGINIRQSGMHRNMLDYLHHLRLEFEFTKEFLIEDGLDEGGKIELYQILFELQNL